MYSIEEINRRLQIDPRGFVQECDAVHDRQIAQAAEHIARHQELSPIILMSGPSASGKSGSTRLLKEKLELKGIHSHSISMHDYFLNIEPEKAPRNIKGEIDYESPFCLDLNLLNRHIAMLEQGLTIHVPHFDMKKQCRSLTETRELSLQKDELVIFEGLHALNDYIAGKNPKALKIFSQLGGEFAEGEVQLLRPQIRFCRRLVRDTLYRNMDPDFTTQLWRNVRRGEKLYSAPFADNADLVVDSFQPYEVSALKPLVLPILQQLQSHWGKEVGDIIDAMAHFEPLDKKHLSPASPVWEFISKEDEDMN